MLSTQLIAASLAAATPATAADQPLAQQVLSALAVIEAANEQVPEDASTGEIPPEQDSPPADEPEATSDEEFDYSLEFGEETPPELDDDPLEGFNRVSYDISMRIDKVVIRPAAIAYRTIIPKPARDGARNVLANVEEPLVFVNDILQLRPGRALRTLGRFLINSTVGIGGLFDVAKREEIGLPHRNNSLGDTFGYYGIGPGPYIYVPILGPTTLRDAVGSAEDLLYPKAIGVPFDRNDYIIASSIVDGLDRREQFDDELKAMLAGAVDPYATFRANFLQDRLGEIAQLKAKDGEEPAIDPLADPLIDPAEEAGTDQAD